MKTQMHRDTHSGVEIIACRLIILVSQLGAKLVNKAGAHIRLPLLVTIDLVKIERERESARESERGGKETKRRERKSERARARRH